MTTTPLTDGQLADIQVRAEAATDGPWWNDEHEIYTVSDLPYEHWIAETCNVDNPQASRANGTFIAHARTDVPALLAELGRVRAELATAKALHAERPLHKLAEDCEHPEPDDDQPDEGDAWAERHPFGMDEAGYTGDRICLDSPIGRSACGTCLDRNTDPEPWPCETATALGLTAEPPAASPSA